MSETMAYNEQQDSIELIKNTKGYSWVVKRYFDFDKVSPEIVINQIEEIDKSLQIRFKGEA